MPSSKYIDKSEDFIPAEKKIIPKILPNKHVVSFDQWCEHNHDHLLDIYGILQDACASTGRHIFDSATCTFPRFCQIAYDNSYKYKKHDTNYEPEERDDTTVIFFRNFLISKYQLNQGWSALASSLHKFLETNIHF